MRFRLSRNTKLTLAIFAVLGLLGSAAIVVPVMMVMTTDAATSTSTGIDDTPCGPTLTSGGVTITLTQAQITNAKTVITTGEQLNVPSRGLVVAVATSLQESTLNNLDYGDRDSIGLFQQRSGWGSQSARMDPAESATMFYTGGQGGQPGLLDIRGWATMPVTQAAQAVQRSAYPNAYAKWEPMATKLVQSVTGNADLGCSDVSTENLPPGTIGTMLQAALAQQGDPYVWGATGPDAFDCSGLVVYSWQQAGYRLTIRTAAQMYEHSDPVTPGQEQPGDLIFGEFGPGGAGHVMIVVSRGVAVEAPHTGAVVEVIHYTVNGTTWKLGRLRGDVIRKI